jgi:hypothetical protein
MALHRIRMLICGAFVLVAVFGVIRLTRTAHPAEVTAVRAGPATPARAPARFSVTSAPQLGPRGTVVRISIQQLEQVEVTGCRITVTGRPAVYCTENRTGWSATVAVPDGPRFSPEWISWTAWYLRPLHTTTDSTGGHVAVNVAYTSPATGLKPETGSAKDDPITTSESETGS